MEIFEKGVRMINKEKIKRNLERMMPRLRAVEVSVSRNPDRSFHSSIKVNLPREIFFASKDAGSYQQSLERAYKAIIRQFHKLKSRNDRRKHSKEPPPELEA